MTSISNGNCENVQQEQQVVSQNIIITAVKTMMDIMIFIITSIGFILQDIFYTIFGYPEKDLKPEIALVTGGGSGIGRQIAKRLSEMGTKVVIWDINAGGIEETIKIVKEMGGSCTGYVVDISKKEDVYKAADIVRKEVGDITLLINNAGVVSGMLLLDTPDYLIERSFNVNVMAHFWTTKAFLPKMIENDHGHIVTIASLAGHVGIPKLIDYCSSKFAAVGFDEALRLELDVLGHQGVQTTCICPYFIQSTGMFGDVSARWVPTLNPNDVAERVIKAIKRNEKVAVIPGYIKILLSLKWMFPWGVVAGFLKRLVLDAAPHTNGITTTSTATTTNNNSINGDIKNKMQITKEREEEKIVNITSTSSPGSDVPKSASILVQRTTINKGERAL